jgi:hypothetical protein
MSHKINCVALKTLREFQSKQYAIWHYFGSLFGPTLVSFYRQRQHKLFFLWIIRITIPIILFPTYLLGINHLEYPKMD